MPIFGWKLSCDFLNKGHFLHLALKNRLRSACDPIAPLHMLQRFMLLSAWRHNVTASFSSPAVVALFQAISSPLSPLGRVWVMLRVLSLALRLFSGQVEQDEGETMDPTGPLFFTGLYFNVFFQTCLSLGYISSEGCGAFYWPSGAFPTTRPFR